MDLPEIIGLLGLVVATIAGVYTIKAYYKKEEKNITNIQQTNTGSGDNVGGDKIMGDKVMGDKNTYNIKEDS